MNSLTLKTQKSSPKSLEELAKDRGECPLRMEDKPITGVITPYCSAPTVYCKYLGGVVYVGGTMKQGCTLQVKHV